MNVLIVCLTVSIILLAGLQVMCVMDIVKLRREVARLKRKTGRG